MSYTTNYVTGMALSQFVHGASTLGVDTTTLLNSVGLSSEDLKPTAKVPESKYEMVILLLMAQTRNPKFAVEIGQQVMFPLYGVLMTLALGSGSLGEAITYLARYQGLATGNCGELSYTKVGAKYTLQMSMLHTNPVIRRLVSECVMTFFSSLPSAITGKPGITLEKITFEHMPYSKQTQLYIENVLQCPVDWGANEYSLTLSEQDHQMPLFGHGDQMLAQAEELAKNQLERIQTQQSLLDKITWHMEEQMLASAPRREEVAKRLNMSTRTLDRRLKDFDTSWQELLDHVRLKHAMNLLSDTENKVSVVAEKLGFVDVRSFQRKFKSWTGMTPSDYRNKL